MIKNFRRLTVVFSIVAAMMCNTVAAVSPKREMRSTWLTLVEAKDITVALLREIKKSW